MRTNKPDEHPDKRPIDFLSDCLEDKFSDIAHFDSENLTFRAGQTIWHIYSGFVSPRRNKTMFVIKSTFHNTIRTLGVGVVWDFDPWSIIGYKI